MKTLFKLCVIAILLFFLPSFSSAQIEKGQFLYSSSANGYIPSSIIAASDGGYAMCGSSINTSLLEYVVFVTKMDVNGNIQWNKIYYSTYGATGAAITQTFDGGYTITGNVSLTQQGDENIYVIKISSTGALQWTKIIEASSPNNGDGGKGIVQTKDSGYAIIAADNEPSVDNMFIVKLNSSGSLLWTKELTGTYNTNATSIVLAKNGDIIGCGSTSNYGKGSTNIYLAEFDNSGNLVKTRTIGGKKEEFGEGIANTKDGGYVVCGSSTSFGADSINGDVYVAKLDSNLNIQWGTAVGGRQSDYAYGVVQTSDGGYEATGFTNSYGDTNEGEIYTVKLDAAGNLKWTNAVASDYANSTGAGIAAYKSNAGAILTELYLACPTCIEAAYVIINDSTGKLCQSSPTGGLASSGGMIDSGGTATSVVLQTTASGLNNTDALTKNTVCSSLGMDELNPATTNNVSIYPNPASDKINIEFSSLPAVNAIRVTDITGRELLSQSVNTSNNDMIQLNVSSLSAGMYFITLEQSTGVQTYKFIKN